VIPECKTVGAALLLRDIRDAARRDGRASAAAADAMLMQHMEGCYGRKASLNRGLRRLPPFRFYCGWSRSVEPVLWCVAHFVVLTSELGDPLGGEVNPIGLEIPLPQAVDVGVIQRVEGIHSLENAPASGSEESILCMDEHRPSLDDPRWVLGYRLQEA
jgi:hypothetical protein